MSWVDRLVNNRRPALKQVKCKLDGWSTKITTYNEDYNKIRPIIHKLHNCEKQL